MADNFIIYDFTGSTQITMRATDNSSVWIPWNVLGNSAGTVAAPVDANGLQIQGPAAENAAAAGNPLATVRYDASDRLIPDGEVGAIAGTQGGAVKTSNVDTNGDAIVPIPQAVFTPRTVKLSSFVLSTDTHADTHVVAVPLALAAAAPANDVTAILTGFRLSNIDDAAIAMRLWFFSSASASMGTISTALSISDADSAFVEYYYDVAAADWVDVGGAQVVVVNDLMVGMEPASTTDDIYVGIEAKAAWTPATAASLTGSFKFL